MGLLSALGRRGASALRSGEMFGGSGGVIAPTGRAVESFTAAQARQIEQRAATLVQRSRKRAEIDTLTGNQPAPFVTYEEARKIAEDELRESLLVGFR